MFRAASVSLSSSLCLNPRRTMLHGRPPSSPSKPPWPKHFKLITSSHAPLPKPSQNQITTTTTAKTQPKSNRKKKPRSPPNHKSNHTHRNQSTKPTKQPKSQNENIESEPTVKKTYIGFVIIF